MKYRKESEDTTFNVQVVDGNNEFIITISKNEDGKWIETSDDAPSSFRATTYSGYLKKDDILEWLSNDYDEVHEIGYYSSDNDTDDDYDEDVDELDKHNIELFLNFEPGQNIDYDTLKSLPKFIEQKWDGGIGWDRAYCDIISLDKDFVEFVLSGTNSTYFYIAIENPFDLVVNEIDKDEYNKLLNKRKINEDSNTTLKKGDIVWVKSKYDNKVVKAKIHSTPKDDDKFYFIDYIPKHKERFQADELLKPNEVFTSKDDAIASISKLPSKLKVGDVVTHISKRMPVTRKVIKTPHGKPSDAQLEKDKSGKVLEVYGMEKYLIDWDDGSEPSIEELDKTIVQGDQNVTYFPKGNRWKLAREARAKVIKGKGRINYDDDIVIVYTPEGKVEYKGLFDDCPYKYDDMKYDYDTQTYKVTNPDYPGSYVIMALA